MSSYRTTDVPSPTPVAGHQRAEPVRRRQEQGVGALGDVHDVRAPVHVRGARDVAAGVQLAAGAVRAPSGVDDPQVGPAEVLGQPLGGRDELRARGTGQGGLHGDRGRGARARPYDRPVVSPFMADPEKVAAIRALMPATGAGIYLNAGSAGPIPAESQRAMDEQAAHELAVGRASGDQFAMVLERQAELRAAIAAVLVADPDDIAITHSTTDGMNLAINALPWRAGDRAITTRHEHLGGVGRCWRCASAWGSRSSSSTSATAATTRRPSRRSRRRSDARRARWS